jgi:predicted PurR-regulated permease PerM
MQAAVGLNPLVAILSFLVGATLFGLPGAIIAVPTAAMLQVIVLDLYEHNIKR